VRMLLTVSQRGGDSDFGATNVDVTAPFRECQEALVVSIVGSATNAASHITNCSRRPSRAMFFDKSMQPVGIEK